SQLSLALARVNSTVGRLILEHKKELMTLKMWKGSMLAAALAAGLLPILLYVYFAQEDIQKYDYLTNWHQLQRLLPALLFLTPGLLIAFSTYIHVVKRRHWGIVILWPVCMVTELAIVLSVPALAYPFQGRQWIFPILGLEFALVLLV